ncbi:MAG: PDDEXK nuclease domain-containing protein [Acidaminococcales bacterium]|jgi:predicted nuclease of restriction endonuclease-like (RecB) superfamily|nr:PDDEXK nuclease domain-containing protein [Acidaminococcales bacterium]
MENSLTLYAPFVKEIKDLIYRRQYEAMNKVNAELIQLYWEIGEEIYAQQQEKGWGKSVVEVLSKELQKEFPGVSGFSARNLWRMRNFYVEYAQTEKLPPLVAEIQKPILPPLVAEISWSKNCAIMEKCKDHSEREFYIKMTRRYGWIKDVLINNIENKAFERYLANQTNFDETVPEKYRLQAKLAVKDDYNFDFIEMGIEHSEAEVEAGIVNNIRAFLAEMGGDFAFIGNQYRIDVDDDDYYIDLLLFHRRLRSLIAIELKIGEFIPECVGKNAVLDELVKLPDENPSIGIIICKSKKRTRVEYTLKTANKPIGVATYSFTDSLPEDLRNLLPSPDEIASIVAEFDNATNELTENAGGKENGEIS